MASLPAQVLYQFIMNHMAPLLASSVAGLSSSYFSGRQVPAPTLVRHDVDEERELDMLHMDRLLSWMRLMFDEEKTPILPLATDRPVADQPDTSESRQAYKKELYGVYVTIRSDYTQYQQWKQYNSQIWLFSSYRKKDTMALAKKILSDIRLFQEGLKMFSMMW